MFVGTLQAIRHAKTRAPLRANVRDVIAVTLPKHPHEMSRVLAKERKTVAVRIQRAASPAPGPGATSNVIRMRASPSIATGIVRRGERPGRRLDRKSIVASR